MPSPWSLELQYALSAAIVRMPTLGERKGQRSVIAQALIPVLAARMGVARPSFDRSAMKAIERATWPGNLRQMSAVLSAVLATHREGESVSGGDIEAQLVRFPASETVTSGRPERRWRPLLEQMFDEGSFSLPALERSAYEAAVERTRGNLSAAARLLGLTRPQLAYRLSNR
jgi:DNA-binding NtrC family response regulator